MNSDLNDLVQDSRQAPDEVITRTGLPVHNMGSRCDIICDYYPTTESLTVL